MDEVTKKECVRALCEYERKKVLLENLSDTLCTYEALGHCEVKKLRCQVMMLSCEIRRVERALDALGKSERLALEHFYIRRSEGAAEDVCEELSVERSQAYRYRSSGLEGFALAFYREEEKA